MEITLFILVYLATCGISVYMLTTSWLREFNSVSRGNMLFFCLMSILGPLSLLISIVIMIVDRIEASDWVNKDFITKKDKK